jgi:hypothetical protein
MTYRSSPGAGSPEDLEKLSLADFRRRMPDSFGFVLGAGRPIPDGVVFVPRILGVFSSLFACVLLLPFFVMPCAVPFVDLARKRVSAGVFVAEIVLCLIIAAVPAFLLWIFGSSLVRAVRYALGRERGGLYWTGTFLLYREGSSITVCPLDALESLDVVAMEKRLPRGGTSRSLRVDVRSRSGREMSVTFDEARVLQGPVEALKRSAAARGKRKGESTAG